MAVQDKDTIKGYFNKGDKPTEAQFVDLIDSYQDKSDVLQALATAAASAAAGELVGSDGAGGLIFTTVTTASIPDAGVGTSALSDASVTSAKIADDAVGSDALNNTGVSAGRYTITQIDVDAQGRITSAANGSDTSLIWNQIQTQTITSATATVEFTSGINTTYKLYAFSLQDLNMSTGNAEYFIRVSDDGGATFKASAGDYQFVHTSQGANNANLSLQRSTAAAQMQFANDMGELADEGLSGVIYMHSPASTSGATYFTHNIAGRDTAGVFKSLVGGGSFHSVSAIDAVQFLLSSGTIDKGTITLYGISPS